MAIKLAVFDIAGTTVEDKDFVANALVKAFEQSDLYINSKFANSKMGMAKPAAIKELLDELFEETPDNLDELAEKIYSDFKQLMLEFYRDDKAVKGKLNAVRTMLALKNAGVKVALDTSFTRDITDVIIDRLGWDIQQVFDFSVTSDDVKNGRPFPDMIQKAMELAGVDSANEVAKIGDTVSDLKQGNSAGCKYVIGLTTGAQAKTTLEKAPHTHLVEDLYEIVGIVC